MDMMDLGDLQTMRMQKEEELKILILDILISFCKGERQEKAENLETMLEILGYKSLKIK